MTAKTIRILERTLLSVGLLLVGVAIVATVSRLVLSRAAIAEFNQRSSEKSSLRDPARVDFSLWEPKRVKAYLKSLSVPVGTPMAVLRIPRLHIEVPVLRGTDEFSLNRGVGWIAGTAQPGEPGNLGIAGHRDGFFRGLKDVKIGDSVEVASVGLTRRYTVDEIEIVLPSETTVLRPRLRPSLTLVTCYPFYFVGDAPLRFVVHASVAETDKAVEGSPNSQSEKP